MGFTVKDILNLIKRFIVFILALAVLGMVMAGTVTHFIIKPHYLSTSEVQWVKGANIDTTIEIVESDDILDAVKVKIEERDYNFSVSQLKNMISVKRVGESNVFDITVKHADSGTAYIVNSALLDLIIDKMTENSITVKIVSEPSSNPALIYPLKKNVVIGALLGVASAFIIIILISFNKHTIYYRKDVEKALPVKILGAIPKRNKDEALKLLSVNTADAVVKEGGKVVAFASVGKDVNYKPRFASLISLIGFGNYNKNDSALDYAKSMALSGKKTLYVSLKDNSSDLGFFDYLLDKTNEINVKQLSVNNLYVLGAGCKCDNEIQLLASKKCENALNGFKNEYDFVVLELPTMSKYATAVSVYDKVDGYVLNAKAGADSVKQLNNSILSLEQLNAKVYGVIISDSAKSDVFGGRIVKEN